MIKAIPRHKSWSKKLFINGDEYFEPSHWIPDNEVMVVGRRLIHKKAGRMIGAATICSLKAKK